MVESFDGLWHNTVIGSHHQNCNVGDLSSTSTHSGESLVTRGINECHRSVHTLVLSMHLISTDVLGDAAGLTGHHVGVSD